jgi:hypothetical protein
LSATQTFCGVSTADSFVATSGVAGSYCADSSEEGFEVDRGLYEFLYFG